MHPFRVEEVMRHSTFVGKKYFILNYINACH